MSNYSDTKKATFLIVISLLCGITMSVWGILSHKSMYMMTIETPIELSGGYSGWIIFTSDHSIIFIVIYKQFEQSYSWTYQPDIKNFSIKTNRQHVVPDIGDVILITEDGRIKRLFSIDPVQSDEMNVLELINKKLNVSP
ncbi:MAG: hypothetical protein LBE12_20835 [Planctomycetaceae bacterium]|nr:hypothetical protein [Planctomycetaceae bacterium]